MTETNTGHNAPPPGWWQASDGNSDHRPTPPPPPPPPPPGYAAAPGWWLASDGNWYPPQAATAGYQRRTNGMAIASMVFGILWLYWAGSILALVFGYLAKQQISESRGMQDGGGMATAGIVLGWIGVGFFSLIVFVAFVGAVAGG